MNKRIRQQLKYTQNFLQSTELVNKLIEMSNLDKDDLVLEIGPGKGIITWELARTVRRVIAVEYDDYLYKKLSSMFEGRKNVEIIKGDFLQYELPEGKEYKVFASIPFNITAEIIHKITEKNRAPQDAYLVIQKEAAWKYIGYPYYKESLRSLLLKPYFEFRILHSFQKTDFRPVPDVDAVFLHIRQRRKQLLKEKEGRLYQDFITYIFTRQNKGLGNKCKRIFTHKQLKRLARDNGFNMDANPTELRFEQWYRLYCFFADRVSAEKQALVAGAYDKLMKEQQGLDRLHRNRRKRK